jgi:hypothetical protein
MAEKPIESAILDEAQGAHRASQKILALMEEPNSDDPIVQILLLLQAIHSNQRTMLTRLEIIERRLASRA